MVWENVIEGEEGRSEERNLKGRAKKERTIRMQGGSKIQEGSEMEAQTHHNRDTSAQFRLSKAFNINSCIRSVCAQLQPYGSCSIFALK